MNLTSSNVVNVSNDMTCESPTETLKDILDCTSEYICQLEVVANTIRSNLCGTSFTPSVNYDERNITCSLDHVNDIRDRICQLVNVFTVISTTIA